MSENIGPSEAWGKCPDCNGRGTLYQSKSEMRRLRIMKDEEPKEHLPPCPVCEGKGKLLYLPVDS